jgi:N4-gp56 family major capsid protein
MATTSISTSHGLTNNQWDSMLFKTYQEKTFFSRFKGTSTDSIIQVKRDLVKKAGDAITFGLAGTLSGAGVTGNNVLGTGDTSNEESMTFYDQKVTIDQIRNGTRIAGLMEEKRVAFDLRNQAKAQLTEWMARNEDAAIFTAINTCDEILSSVITGTGVTVDAVIDMKKEAMFPTANNITGGTTTSRKLNPIKLEGGEEVFVLGVNPADAAALKKSADFKTYQYHGNVRGGSNPIFTGALGNINGVIIHEHSGFVAGSPVLMGAQAAFLAYGKEIMYGEDSFDYTNQTGFMIGSVRGVALAKFLNEANTAQGSHGAIKFVTSA